MNILVLQGPNLNLLGTREAHIYGRETLKDIHGELERQAEGLGVQLEFLQTNHEGEMLDRIHGARGHFQGIVINAGAWTHTSVALADALAGVEIPFIEIHISNVHKREEFRHNSYLSPLAAGIVVGFGKDGYRLALDGLAALLRREAS